MTVIDFEQLPPGGGAAIHAAGVKGAIVYIKPAHFQWPKAATPLEIVNLAFNGVEIAYNYENNTGDYLGGYAQGVVNGREAQQAMAELSQNDPSIPVFVSLDTDIPPSKVSLAEAYVHGFYDACQHEGVAVYGEGLVIAAANAKYGWRSESTSFPDDPRAHIVLTQHYGQSVPGLGGSYDVNTITPGVTDWGQTPRPHPTPQPPEIKVQPQYAPARVFNFVSELRIDAPDPHAGTWGLQPDWGIITFAGPFAGTLFHDPNVSGRTPALLVPVGLVVPGANPPLSRYPDWARYEAIATSGERYLPPQPV